MQTATWAAPPIDLVLERLDNVKRHGDYWMASSPVREDRNPSLQIRVADDGKVLFKDYGGGTVEEIVAAIGLTMGDLFVAEKRSDRVVTQTTTRKAKRAYKKPEVPAEATFREGAIKWFGLRGIAPETMAHFGVFTAERFFKKADKVTPAICLPYHKDGTVVNVKYRSATVKDWLMEVDAEPCWFNLDHIAPDARQVVIAEGEFDVMAIWQATGIEAISPPNGCESVSDEVFLSGASFLADDRVRVVLAGDNDKAGREMMDGITNRVGKERVSLVEWPEGCKDANDALLQHGPEAIKVCVECADPIPVEGVIRPISIMADYLQLYDSGLPPGISTGLAPIDEFYTVKPGLWTAVTGSPGSGKTNLLDMILTNIAERDGSSFAICSLENKNLSRHMANIVPKFLRKPFREGRSERMSREEAQYGGLWMNEHFDFIQPEAPTIEAVLRAAKASAFSRGIKGLVIDPWNELDHPPSGLNSGDYISKCLSLIREFAFLYDVHVWLVAHPTKLNKDGEGQYPVPTLYDISGSAHFFNKCDFGFATWRNKIDFSDPVQMHVQKSRHAEVASIGKVLLGYDPYTTRYYDLAATGENDKDQWRPTTMIDRMLAQEEEEFVALTKEDEQFMDDVLAGDA